MQFTDLEAQYLDRLPKGMTFEEMAIELDMTVQELEEFGTDLFDRVFEERRQGIM